MTLREIRSSPAAAWAGPLLIFLSFQLLVLAVRTNSADVWYRTMPEQWVYPLQTIVTLGAVAFWWRNYTFRPLNAAHVFWAVVAGVIGIALWILPSWLYDHGFTPEIEWLGFLSRAGGDGAFDPTMWEEKPPVYWSVVAMRLLRMTVAVAFAEELFWRGFLWRMASDPYRDFSRVAFAKWSWTALGATVVLFAFSHGTPDRLAAVVWCLIVSWLYVRTKSVGACVIAHAVSNLLLGIYVLVTRQWGFW